ncbi:cysteine-rich receptor protein kinase [Trifolium repens]|nr:cysteine-rich receptor protein kinase [Trifolium repens]
MRRQQLNLLNLITTLITLLCSWSFLTQADPQTRLINKGCSTYNATNLSNFYQNLNTTLLDLKTQIGNENKHFATAQSAKGANPVYALFQCRNYLSNSDCSSCFAVAAAQIRNCSAGSNGARVIYDGCFLRYESNGFFDQTTLPGNSVLCGTQTANGATAFDAAAQQVLLDLQTATPKIPGFFAATKTPIAGNAIYAIAQCAETVTESGCLDCLTVGFTNIQGCFPNTDGEAFDAGCFMRYSEKSFFADNQTIDITPFLKQESSSNKGAIIGGVVGGVAIVLILLALFVWLRLKKKPKRHPRGDILGATELKGPVTYRYNDLKSATKNFSDENKLGEGGFGDVYKGTLKNGNVVAVKKMIKGQERILVYEYMANNSLDKFLFGEKKGSLNWIQRDIKASNILLDDDLQPKIADFGLARLLPEDQSHVSTRFAGTLGYTAPEYAIHGQLSVKADAYSFGVVVLEIISGQKSSELREDADGEFLLQRAWKLYEVDRHLDLVDKTLNPSDYDAEEVKKVIAIALLCTQATAATRPTMSEIVVLLKSKNFVEHMRPTMPVFVNSNLRPQSRTDTSTSTASSTSNATVSTSILSAR